VDDQNDTHEIAAGAGLPLTKRLRISGSVIYNAYEHVIQRHGGRLSYEHPCYYFSLEYNRDNAIKNDYVGNTTYGFKFGMSVDGKHY
jgi:lipopolysaccharide assembly outer membrane protein LptD (OstA)